MIQNGCTFLLVIMIISWTTIEIDLKILIGHTRNQIYHAWVNSLFMFDLRSLCAQAQYISWLVFAFQLDKITTCSLHAIRTVHIVMLQNLSETSWIMLYYLKNMEIEGKKHANKLEITMYGNNSSMVFKDKIF